MKRRSGLAPGFLDPTNAEKFWEKPDNPLTVTCGYRRVPIDSTACQGVHDASTTVWAEEPAFRLKISLKISTSSRLLRSQVYSSAVRAACDPSWSRSPLFI